MPARPWGRWLGLGTLALVASWFSLREAVVESASDFPALGEAIRPAAGRAEATIALNRAAQAGGAADAATRRYAASALRHAPLLSAPLAVFALDASARGDEARAARLFAEVRRRDPRSVIARYWLFDHYIRRGDYQRGIAEAGPLTRLQPAAAPGVAAVLLTLVDMPAARPMLTQALRAAPAWRPDFFRQLVADPRLRAEAPALLAASGGGGARGQAAVIAGMIRAGDIAAAHALWGSQLPARYRAVTGVYDGRFQGWPGPPPFNWRLARGATREGGGLAVRDEGEAARTVAEQLVPVAPGAYRLGFTVRPLEGSRPGPELEASVRCARQRAVLARHGVSGERAVAERLDLIVPANCPAVAVRFAVAPGEMPGRVALRLGDVVLTRR